jgi:hypothetical protein
MPAARLWTPIANAFDAYRRRIVMDARAEYEHIWRLMHIQEAVAVCLSSLLATRLARVVDESAGPSLEPLREALTGVRSASDEADSSEGAVELSPWRDGSIGAWIDLLRRFGATPLVSNDPFLDALASYLGSNPNRPLAFADTWSRIAPVSDAFREPTLSRVNRLGAINSFRNKLAHVPVPQRLLEDLHAGLRVEVLDGLTDKFNPVTDATSRGFMAISYREPLTGVLYCGDTYLTGINEVGVDGSRTYDSTQLMASYGKATAAVEWPVEPFFRVDGEAKAALLFRVGDLDREPGGTGYTGEYHRFAAELEPVTYAVIPTDDLAPWIPASPPERGGIEEADDQAHTHVPPGGVTPEATVTESIGQTPTPRELRRLAEDAFSARDYPSAVKSFEALAERDDSAHYNDVARSKHGAALWRAAERDPASEMLRPRLERAVELLKGAEKHRDPRYAGRSAYECSKALWHLWRLTHDRDQLLESLAAAGRAVTRSPEEAFISWQARVKSDAEREFPQGLPGAPDA